MNYINFDLDVFAYKATSEGERFSVRVASSPVGEQRLTEAGKGSLPLHVRQSIGALRRRQLTLAELITFGEELGNALFPPRVRNFLNSSLNRLKDDEGLRIRLKLDTYGLAEVPWEYSYLPPPDLPAERRGPEGFLALNRRISLVRYEVQGQPLVSLDPGVVPLRLVALFANPNDPAYEKLDLAVEQRTLAQTIGELPRIHADYYPDATADTLGAALVRDAHIFHFSGHGQFQGDMGERYGSLEGAGAVILVGDDGHANPFSAQKLAVNLRGRGVRLAVLTACEVGQRDAVSAWAGVVTALTHAGIPAVIGMQYRVLDQNALAFSRAFYRVLADHQPIDDAVTAGRLAIFNRGDENERDWGVPVLYLRALDDGVLFPQPENKPPVRNPPPILDPSPEPVDKRRLREVMLAAFSTDELEILCSDVQQSLADAGIELQVNLDVVGGGSKAIQVLNLIQYLDRRGYLDYLVKAIRQQRLGII